jgi:hypothetical protein
MFNKTCLLIYIGNGYSVDSPNYNGSYTYSVDMRDNQDNHNEMIIQPLKDVGYSVDKMVVTNKHKFYHEFVKELEAIEVDYEDFSRKDEKFYLELYERKVPQLWGPGNFRSGGRLLKLKQPLPEYDLYVFVRADAEFKLSLKDLKVDQNKMNFLWAETDFRMFTERREEFLEAYGTEWWFWNTYNRVAGNVLNVIPKKYLNIFISYYWMEHVALHGILRDLSPVITVEHDVNLMMGYEKCYVTDVRFSENPVYTIKKKDIKYI